MKWLVIIGKVHFTCGSWIALKTPWSTSNFPFHTPNCNFFYFVNNKLFLVTRYPNLRRTLFFTSHTFTMLLVSFYLSVPMMVIWSSVLVRFISLANYRNSILSSLKAKTRNMLDCVSGKLMEIVGFAHIQTQESDECSGLHLSCHLPA